MSIKKINSRIWIERNGKPFLGYGKILLLKKIEETNSINAAAKELSISYKKAWEMMNSINETGKEPATIKKTGGRNGGGTVVTGYGKELIRQFEEINDNCIVFLEEQLKRYEL
ncbi:MAG TPA: hypothetical protein VK833_04000 [Gillisia sp.]|nr:hypothetical protein [Gillisia sp.]